MKHETKWFWKSKRVDHEGFYKGAQGVPPDESVAEVAAQFDREASDARYNSVTRLKALEGRHQYLNSIANDVQTEWQNVRQSVGDECPQIVMPVVLTIIGFAALISEAVMLAPTFDDFGVADPTLQLVVAFGVAGAAMIPLHWALESVYKRLSFAKTVLARTAGVAVLIAVACLGVMRCRHMAFAAGLSDSPLSRFLSSYPIITTFVFVFVTLAFPIAAAVASTHGMDTIRAWTRYVRARHRAARLPEERMQLAKKIEAEKEKQQHELKGIEERKKSFVSCFRADHELGAAIGAKQPAMWMVWLKATIAGLIALVVTWPLGLISIPIVAAVFLAAWIYYYQARMHPTPAQFFERRSVQFRTVDETPFLASRHATNGAAGDSPDVYRKEAV